MKVHSIQQFQSLITDEIILNTIFASYGHYSKKHLSLDVTNIIYNL